MYVTRITHNMWLESNLIREIGESYVCDSNHNLQLIQIMQPYDLSHKLHMIQITQAYVSQYSFWFESQLTHDSNHTVSHIFLLALSNLTWIMVSTWFKSWPFMTRITFLTWIKSQENESFLLCWSCSTLLIHLAQTNKCSLHKSIIIFSLILFIISSTYINKFPLSLTMNF